MIASSGCFSCVWEERGNLSKNRHSRVIVTSARIWGGSTAPIPNLCYNLEGKVLEVLQFHLIFYNLYFWGIEKGERTSQDNETTPNPSLSFTFLPSFDHKHTICSVQKTGEELQSTVSSRTGKILHNPPPRCVSIFGCLLNQPTDQFPDYLLIYLVHFRVIWGQKKHHGPCCAGGTSLQKQPSVLGVTGISDAMKRWLAERDR